MYCHYIKILHFSEIAVGISKNLAACAYTNGMNW